MKINQAYWDHRRKIVEVITEDKEIVLIFDYKKNLGNKFLTPRQIMDIHVYSTFYPTARERPPIRNIQKFMLRVINGYDGFANSKARNWLNDERRKNKSSSLE